MWPGDITVIVIKPQKDPLEISKLQYRWIFFTVWGSSGGKVVFHHRLDLLFVAPFPNAMIKNNNIDNRVPSTKQWTEIPTSVLQKNGIHAPAGLPS